MHLVASNDTIVDRYGTVITVEALMRDWWPGYQQHRTLSLQHNIPKLRGVEGHPAVGIASRVDFAPQLEVEARILHPQALALVEQGKVRSASLEFVPLEVETRAGEDGKRVEVYHRLSSEPEHCGLSLVDVPGVPGADILSIRTLPALWAAAVVDPLVLNGQITDPELVRQLAWLPHHDTRSHAVDESLLARALEDLEAGRVQVPPFASLSAAQVVERARAHLERHTTSLRLGRSGRAEPLKEGDMTDQERAEKAQGAAPEVRAASEDQETRGLLARLFGRGNVTITASDAPVAAEAVEERVEPEPAAEEKLEQPTRKRSARDEWLYARTVALMLEEGRWEGEARALAEEQLAADYGLQARLAAAPTVDAPEQPEQPEMTPEIRSLLRRPEDPMAAIASGLRIRSSRMDGEQLLAEVLARTVVPQASGQRPTTRQLTEAYSMMREAGINERALTIEANGTVIYEDMARQFVVRPEPDVVFRNHMSSVPMGGVSKRTFPRFDRAGITHQWNRASVADINATDPTTDTFSIEVAEMNSKVNVADSFQLFNASGASFVSQHLLPAIRGAAQYEEDRVFFLGTGVATDPVEFKGLMTQPGTTSVAGVGTDGDAFTLTVLNSLLRAMPVRYRNQVSRLAFYLPVSLADDFVDIISDRATLLGDAYLGAGGAGAGPGTTLGPTPVGYYRRIPVYAVPQLPDNQTQGSSTGVASTIFLVHRDIPVIGDALTIRIEPFRAENFITKLQLQQWVGLGYQWSDAIVKRIGVLAKAP